MKIAGWRVACYIPGRGNCTGKGPEVKERMASSGIKGGNEKDDFGLKSPPCAHAGRSPKQAPDCFLIHSYSREGLEGSLGSQ